MENKAIIFGITGQDGSHLAELLLSKQYQVIGVCRRASTNNSGRIKHILSKAIEVGGTTLRDFTNSSGNPGYFKQSLQVYGRGNEACKTCHTSLKEIRLGQRSTVYCPQCQN